MKTCGKCGESYEGYTVLIEDSVVAYSKWMSWKERYGDFCWDCFTEVNPKVGIANIS